jgi:fucose 4-O-acetylase-like acetyltransferase
LKTSISPPQGSKRTDGTRQTWIDQSRWVAIVLVVVGHAVGMLRNDSALALTISNYVYMFHIPVLVVLAGWGAKNLQADGSGLSKITRQLIAPYIVFQLIAFLFNFIFEGTNPSWTFVEQTFGLWFLVALALWRLIGPWFRGVRYALLISVVLSLLAGLTPSIGGFLSLSRVLFFLPMFLVGPWLVDRISEWRGDPRFRALGLVVLSTGLAAVIVFGENFWRLPFLGNLSYESLEVSDAEGMLWRLLAMGSGLLMAAGFMLALPGQPSAPTGIGNFVADAGRYTMYPYLLHLPLLTVIGATPFEDMGHPTLRTAVFVAVATILCLVTVWRPVRFLTRPLVEPLWFLPPARSEHERGRAESHSAS